MSNQLIKLVSYERRVLQPFAPGTPGTPATPGTPEVPPTAPHPAYCIDVPHYQPEYAWYIFYDYDQWGNPIRFSWILPTGRTIVTYTHECHDATPGAPGVAGTPDVPAAPGFPGQQEIDVIIPNRNIGWNGSAVSVQNFGPSDNVKLLFRVPQATAGIVCGLNSEDVSSSYPEIDHAFYVTNGQWFVMENGAFMPASGIYTDPVTVPCFAIIRFNGQVSYHVWNGSAWIRKYTSTKRSTDPVFADSSLYLGGDLIG